MRLSLSLRCGNLVEYVRHAGGTASVYIKSALMRKVIMANFPKPTRLGKAAVLDQRQKRQRSHGMLPEDLTRKQSNSEMNHKVRAKILK